MNITLILIGVGCIIGAIAGGGVKLVQIELSPVSSLRRQLILGCFGLVLVLFGLNIGGEPSASNPNQKAQTNTNDNDNEAHPRQGPQTASDGATPPTRSAGPLSASTNGPNEQDYILPFSQDRLLVAADLAGLSASQLRIARNEIYARHGRRFVSSDLAEYFSKKNWYHAERDKVTLTTLEEKNVSFIQDFEKFRG